MHIAVDFAPGHLSVCLPLQSDVEHKLALLIRRVMESSVNWIIKALDLCMDSLGAELPTTRAVFTQVITFETQVITFETVLKTSRMTCFSTYGARSRPRERLETGHAI